MYLSADATDVVTELDPTKVVLDTIFICIQLISWAVVQRATYSDVVCFSSDFSHCVRCHRCFDSFFKHRYEVSSHNVWASLHISSLLLSSVPLLGSRRCTWLVPSWTRTATRTCVRTRQTRWCAPLHCAGLLAYRFTVFCNMANAPWFVLSYL